MAIPERLTIQLLRFQHRTIHGRLVVCPIRRWSDAHDELRPSQQSARQQRQRAEQAEQARDDAICANADVERQLRADLEAANELLEGAAECQQRMERAEAELSWLKGRVYGAGLEMQDVFNGIFADMEDEDTVVVKREAAEVPAAWEGEDVI